MTSDSTWKRPPPRFSRVHDHIPLHLHGETKCKANTDSLVVARMREFSRPLPRVGTIYIHMYVGSPFIKKARLGIGRDLWGWLGLHALVSICNQQSTNQVDLANMDK